MNFLLEYDQFRESTVNTVLASSSSVKPRFTRQLVLRTYFDSHQYISNKFVVINTEGIEKEHETLGNAICEYNKPFIPESFAEPS
jgi:hypothetical protein